MRSYMHDHIIIYILHIYIQVSYYSSYINQDKLQTLMFGNSATKLLSPVIFLPCKHT